MMRRRILAGVAGLALLVGLAVAPPVQRTDAAFTDSEFSTATVTALKLAPPQVTSFASCIRPPLLGGSFLKVVWQWPSTAYSSLTPANVTWKVGTATITPTWTGPDVNGRYTADITTGLLDGLLGSLLGANITFEMHTVTGNWTSQNATTITYNAPLLGGAPTCTFTNGTA